MDFAADLWVIYTAFAPFIYLFIILAFLTIALEGIS